MASLAGAGRLARDAAQGDAKPQLCRDRQGPAQPQRARPASLMPDIDNQRISGYFAHGDGTKDPFEKGRALENLIAYLFELIPGMFVTARNTMDVGGAQEIDIAFWNEGHPEGLRLFDYVLLVERKHWSEPVGHAELAGFSHNLRSRRRPQGLLAAANGITADPSAPSPAHRPLSRAV